MQDDAVSDGRIFAGRPVLVTGGSGFIGFRLCRRLRDAGATVHATVRNTRRPAEGVTWHRLDLGERAAVDALMESCRPEIVVHLASHVSGSRERAAVMPTFEANLASTVYLLDAAARLGCRRFVQAGSLEEVALGEALATPASPYAAAKLAASSYARMFHALYATPVVLARLFMVYGPGQLDHRKLVPYVILRLLRGATPELSSGTRPVDWIYVDDVVDGLVEAAFGEGLEGRQVDLGSGRLETIRAVVETLYRILAPEEAPPFGTRPERPHEQVREARLGEWGWRPRVTLEEGLRATVEWYRQELAAGRIRDL